MARIQQSIDIGVPAHIVYHQLLRFEDYPRFMQSIDEVHRLDDTLHWTARQSNRAIEWDATITEQIPYSCVAWKSTSGPTNIGKIEIKAASPQVSRVILTLESPVQDPSVDTQPLEQDLARLKELIETGQIASSGVAEGAEGAEGTEDPVKQKTMQSSASLSQSSNDEAEDRRFSVAEEVNLDQQSDQTRHVGQMPPDADEDAATNPAEGMADTMQENRKDAQDKKDLKKSIERAVPPSP